MNNSSRGKRALAGLITLTAFLMSAFIIPENANAQIILGTPGRDTYAIGSAKFLKADVSGKGILLYWRPDIPPIIDNNASYFTVVYRSEGDQSNFKQIAKIWAPVSIFTDVYTNGLTPGKQYFYKVAYGRIRVPAEIYGGKAGSPPWDVQGSVSNVVNITLPEGEVVIPSPIVLTARVAENKTVELSWNGRNDAIEYKVYRKVAGGLYSLVAENLKTTGLIDVKVEPNTEYSYYVVPRTISGLQSSSEVASVKIPTSFASDTPASNIDSILKLETSLIEPADADKKSVLIVVKIPKFIGENNLPDYFRIYRSVDDNYFEVVNTIDVKSSINKSQTDNYVWEFYHQNPVYGKVNYYRVTSLKKINSDNAKKEVDLKESSLVASARSSLDVSRLISALPYLSPTDNNVILKDSGGRVTFDISENVVAEVSRGETLKLNYMYKPGSDGVMGYSNVNVGVSIIRENGEFVYASTKKVFQSASETVYPDQKIRCSLIGSTCYHADPVSLPLVKFGDQLSSVFEYYINPIQLQPGLYTLQFRFEIVPIRYGKYNVKLLTSPMNKIIILQTRKLKII